MKSLSYFLIQCLVVIAVTLASFSSFAKDNIIDPTVISISSWTVLKGNMDASLDKPSIFGSQWLPMENYNPPYFHIPIKNQRWFHASFIIGWHFKHSQLALTLGPLFSDAEVFVNNVKLTELNSNHAARFFRSSQTKIYLLSSNKLWFSFLDFKKANQILVHLIGNKEPLMLQPNQVKVNNYDTLALQAKDSDTLIKVSQGSMVALLLAFCLFSVFMRAVGFKERENNLFGFYVLCVAGGILSDSLLLPNQIGYWLANSSFPFMFTTFAVSVLVTLLSPGQILSTLARILLLSNILVLIFLLIGQHNSVLYQWFIVVNQLVNMMSVLQELVRSLLKNDTSSSISNRFLLTLILLGWGVQFLWAFDYSPVQPFNLTLFIASIVLLLNVAQRFKAMASSLLTLSNRLVSIREKERTRLTRDIHDGVGQGLSTLKLLINLNARKLDSTLGDMLKVEVANTSETLKSVIRNLKPIEVTSGSPTEAIISLTQHNCNLSKITLRVLSKDNVILSQERAYQVYRICQEALNNAIKHSGAKEITLSFQIINSLYRVQVTDDGKGLKDDISGDSYGMSSMHERTMILNANLSVTNRALGGTIVLLEVPIND